MTINLPIFTLSLLFVFTLALFICHLIATKSHKKARDEFMAIMIHELRSPLSVMKSSADLILKEAARLSQEQISEMLKQIEDSSTELLSLVNNLLDIAKIEAGKIELFMHKVDICELIRSEIHYYENLARDKKLELKFTCDSQIPELTGDPEKIKHVLNNLLSNAIKYTDQGFIELKAVKDKNFAVISVADTGIGISNELKSKLFDKYKQVRELPKREKGTGLGLVIAKGIIQAHGGKIWVEDNKPNGARFIFTLPLG